MPFRTRRKFWLKASEKKVCGVLRALRQAQCPKEMVEKIFLMQKITRTDKHSGDVELHLFVEFRGNKKRG